ncbi:molybdopterin-guanine dinucleotide biosynthesis protein B [Vibrio sp. 99-8-1]|nr:molybdopterin-guanine dinucleotide biosynthesis protein B [Vibrio sp. 99-8-1]
MSELPNLPLLGFAAFSGTGKTTLLEALLPVIKKQGIRVAVLKHAHHDFDLDTPGKDSYRLRKAGADQMLVASGQRHVLFTETPQQEESFEYLLNMFDHSKLDLILVEGCKSLSFDKIELHREAVGKPWLYQDDSNIIAIAADTKVDSKLPQMDINDINTIAQFVVEYVAKFNKG